MTVQNAIFHLKNLLTREADCRDGNFDLTKAEIEAIKTLIRFTETGVDNG